MLKDDLETNNVSNTVSAGDRKPTSYWNVYVDSRLGRSSGRKGVRLSAPNL